MKAEVVGVDDLSVGFLARVADVPLQRVDIGSPECIDALAEFMRCHRVDAVMYLAAKKSVSEPVAKPLAYEAANIRGLEHLMVSTRPSASQRCEFHVGFELKALPLECPGAQSNPSFVLARSVKIIVYQPNTRTGSRMT